MNRFTCFALAGFVLAGLGQAVAQTAAPVPTIVTVASSANPVVEHASVTLTATVQLAGPASAKPTGTIEFVDGATSLGTASLSERGGAFVASLPLASLPVGPHPITARYSGDTNFVFAVSAPLMQFVTAVR